MKGIVRHRLYVSAVAVTGLFAAATLGTYAVVRVHDYVVNRADFDCYGRAYHQRAPSPGDKIPEPEIREMGRQCHIGSWRSRGS